MDLRFGQRDGTAEDVTMAIGIGATGDEHGGIEDLTGLTHFLVTGIEHEVAINAELPGAPGLEHIVELGGGTRDLGRANVQTTEFFHDLLHAPG